MKRIIPLLNNILLMHQPLSRNKSKYYKIDDKMTTGGGGDKVTPLSFTIVQPDKITSLGGADNTPSAYRPLYSSTH